VTRCSLRSETKIVLPTKCEEQRNNNIKRIENCSDVHRFSRGYCSITTTGYTYKIQCNLPQRTPLNSGCLQTTVGRFLAGNRRRQNFYDPSPPNNGRHFDDLECPVFRGITISYDCTNCTRVGFLCFRFKYFYRTGNACPDWANGRGKNISL